MTVTVYTPGLTVTLIKLVDRENGVATRAQGASRTVDLTPFLGEAGTVQTTKTLRGDPAGGFTVSFADQPDPETDDTLYARIEPMDIIEIRAAREPQSYNGADLPLVMRGFVTSVQRDEGIGEDGPHRAVVVSGHDFGKLWQIHSVWTEMAASDGLLETFGLQALLGIDPADRSVGDFVRVMVEEVMNGKLEAMESFTSQLLPRFTAEVSVTAGSLLPGVVATIGNETFWQIIAGVADQPWNELFIRDDEDGPTVVFRPAPFKAAADGSFLLAGDGAVDPGTTDVDIADVVHLTLARSDSRVANFFWTPPGGSSLDNNAFVTTSAIVDGSLFQTDHGNNAPELYGERKMEAASGLVDDGTSLASTLPAAERPADGTKTIQWYRKRALQLQAMNEDNSVLEDGAAVLKGSEEYAIGTYLRITRGELTFEGYITAVSHTIPPLAPWTTTVSLERSTGFLERLKLTNAPYNGEGRSGPYST